MPPPKTMRAARFHTFGPPEVVHIESVPTPEPAPGEVLVQVRAAALNHLDLWVRRGLPIETTMPHIGGSDFAGTIAALGPGVTGWPLGSRVLVDPALACGSCFACRRAERPLCPDFRILGEHTDGGFAEYALAPATNLHPIPDTISFELAACLPVSYQTAWRALITRGRLRPGEEVLILGASGATALAAVQIALLAGARVFAVTRGAVHVARLEELGVERAFDRAEVDFAHAIREATGRRGVDLVVENVGAPTFEASVRSLAPGGRLVTYGATAGPRAELDLPRLFWKQLEIIGTTMASASEFEAMLRSAWRGALVPIIDTILPLHEARAAHERLERGDHFGKIVLLPAHLG